MQSSLVLQSYQRYSDTLVHKTNDNSKLTDNIHIYIYDKSHKTKINLNTYLKNKFNIKSI